ncbi:kinase-like protein [Pseudovirgaria hyperparasitica]|uniref:non-specific serine/threonine protein kinase n=1 Tax=Pseudovirgaria hyperparasitica TaxID=470096 RepID=A0A6A6WCP4_9PEZI|nr:kinase-like protein [Pseudovirgaria hyperparasitica]KAF2759730.1 kinase-like protein [Pseudovirgaria hyperparasitica]
MGAPPTDSQVTPLPTNLPFRFVSKTIGQGAYASIRKACPLDKPAPIIAIKLINKRHAHTQGKLSPKQLKTEITLHEYLGKHHNIIQCFGSGEDACWTWIAMELADGGDLFDKIEADEGVGENIAHFYFTQLLSAVGYMHSMGVAHRDLKPENVLLSADGDLKLADFGLAALFEKSGKTRLCTTVCGSPPYIAPEIVSGKKLRNSGNSDVGYAANIADIWSVGVVLFVLLVGNTPWDEPTARSYEFQEYVTTKGHTTDELWQKLPQDILSLLRGMLRVDPHKRFTLDEIRTHPWYTRQNRFLSASGKAADPINMATQMMESLHVDVNAPISTSQQRGNSQHDSMEIDTPVAEHISRLAATQPETPTSDTPFDWERPVPVASQPVTNGSTYIIPDVSLMTRFNEDLSLSQFSQNPSVPLSLTQAARKFGDIVPSHSLTRFVSALKHSLLLPLLSEALHRLGVPIPAFGDRELTGQETMVWIRVKTVDGRSQGLNGQIVVERLGTEFLQVSFERKKGDPLEWRRFFKNVVVLCRDAVLRPAE